MMPLGRVSRKGFSLVEILVVIAIIGIVMGAVYSLYITNLRRAYTTDEVSDMQMNLRLAMDSVVRDLRMAGMFVDYQSGTTAIQGGITATNDNTGISSPFTDPISGLANTGSDIITLNVGSATGIYGRISVDNSSNPQFILTPKSLATQAGDAESFQVGDIVRIIRPRDNSEPAVGTTFPVTATTGGVGATAQTVTVSSRGTVEFFKTDVLAKVNAYNPPSALTPTPNTIQYAVITNGASPSTVTTHPNCPVNQFCLGRRLNGELDPTAGNGPRWEIVAQNIRNFQIRYVTSDNAADISDTPPADLSTVTSVQVVLSGQTAAISNNLIKVRQLESYVKLVNRRN
jgi:prepilin-type N-terminal cleavage/methylation domain-containing protein